MIEGERAMQWRALLGDREAGIALRGPDLHSHRTLLAGVTTSIMQAIGGGRR